MAVVGHDVLTSSEDLIAAIQSALNRPPMVTIAGNGRQLGNPTLVDDRLVLHLVNYDRARQFDNLRVTLAVGAWRKDAAAVVAGARTASWLTPDGQATRTLGITWRGDTAEVVVPRLNVSGVLVIGHGR